MNGPLTWHGGKHYLAEWLHINAPSDYTHRLIPYFGGGGELWNWSHQGISETINDKNNLLVNFYRVLRHEPAAFIRIANLIPFSEEEYKNSWRMLKDWGERPINNVSIALAVSFFVVNRMSRQGLMRNYATPTRRTRRGMNEKVSAWLSAVEGLPEVVARLNRVEIRCMDAILFIKKYDHSKAFFYLDPPYLHDTRNSVGEYGENEMSYDDHELLLKVLGCLKGRFMLSAYQSSLYDDYMSRNNWRREQIAIDNKASSSKSKETKYETIYMNY